MNLKQLIHNNITQLPIYSNHETFRALISSKFQDYKSLVEKVDPVESKLSDFVFNKLKRTINICIEGIQKSIDAYYSGEPSTAFNILADFMKESEIETYLDKNSMIEPYKNLYRIRVIKGNYPLSKEELFHIPFDERGKVSSQRFSIPGLPTLYLSNSVYVAWEEMKRPSFNSINAVRISNTEWLRLIDLTTDSYCQRFNINKLNEVDLIYQTAIWPIIAACSIKVKESNAVFKSEYIIPQLLMQWINKNYMDGIKYSSTHIDLNRSLHNGIFYNVALPTKTYNVDKGYCGLLMERFKSTSVLPMELKQFVTQTSNLHGLETISYSVNDDIDELELFKGHPQPYSQTAFGHLEHVLKNFALEAY